MDLTRTHRYSAAEGRTRSLPHATPRCARAPSLPVLALEPWRAAAQAQAREPKDSDAAMHSNAATQQ